MIASAPLIDWGNANVFTYLFGKLTPTESASMLAIVAIVGAIAVRSLFKRVRKKDPNEPLSTLDEFDKPGTVHIYEIDRELEGASFLTFERANGDLDTKGITQPFTFVMADNTIERHHLNARGAFRCLNPAKLFESYVASKYELNNIAAFTEQLIRALRVGSLINQKGQSHLRTFVMIFLLSGLIGLGIAAATTHH